MKMPANHNLPDSMMSNYTDMMEAKNKQKDISLRKRKSAESKDEDWEDDISEVEDEKEKQLETIK